MHPVACILGVGLGQEGGCHAMFAGHALDQHLEQPGVIGSAQGIAMGEVYFKLPDARLRERGLGWNAHGLGPVIEIIEKGREAIECVEAANVGVPLWPPGDRIAGR